MDRTTHTRGRSPARILLVEKAYIYGLWSDGSENAEWYPVKWHLSGRLHPDAPDGEPVYSELDLIL